MGFAEFTIENPIKSDRFSPRRWVLSHVGHHKLLIVILFIGAFGNAALAAVIPVYVGRAFDAAAPAVKDMGLIGIYALIIILSQATRSVLQFGRNFSANVLGERVERDAREELYTSLLGKSMAFHARQPVGDTMARATNDVRELNLMMSPGVNLVVGSINFMLMPLVVAPTYHPQLILAPAFYILLYFLAVFRFLKTLAPIADNVRQSFGDLNSRLAEAIDGIETVKGSAQEDQEVGRFIKKATVYQDAVVEQGRVEARYLPLLLLGLTYAIAFAHAMILYQNPEIEFSVGQVIGYVSLMTLFGFPTFISVFAYAAIARGMAGARRILTTINTTTELDQNETGYEQPITGDIVFDGVYAGYTADTNVLHDVSFTITAGQTVAIVGQTGAGKSTLAKLLNRTWDVHTGSITIDGRDVREWNLAALRQQISIIEQDIFLFSRSIADNIAFGNPAATRQQVIEAAAAAQAHDFILGFVDGYDTVIGERGVTLSGGQRQRIALARAFLTQPRILILDDSTSAVDSATEDKIQQAITQAAERQTTILITHRLSQIRWADQVILLRKGRVVATGNHDTLMENYPAYRRIFEQYDS